MNVTNASLNTTIENDFNVSFDHRAFNVYIVWLGIDNALIEIDNEEVPILEVPAKLHRKNNIIWNRCK